MIIRYGSAAKIVKTASTLSGLVSGWRGGLVKRAAKQMDSFDLDPDKYVYLRNRAVSAMELHSCNQNFDAFEYNELADKYHTFIGKPVSVDHIGTDVIGLILDSEFIPALPLRDDIGVPLLPYNETYAVLQDKVNAGGSELARVFDVASSLKCKNSSDPMIVAAAVAKHMCNCGWVENVWAVDRKAAEEHTHGMVEAILNGEVTDSSMGCFCAGTKILMSDFSEKNIEDISVGDSVITHTGSVGVVKGLFSKEFDKGIYNINATGLSDEVCATHEHPFYALRKEDVLCAEADEDRSKCFPVGSVSSATSYDTVHQYEYGYKKKVCDKTGCSEFERKLTPAFLKVSDLKVGDYVSYSFSDEIRPTYLTKEFFRLLGYYLAEGTVVYSHGKPNWTEFTFHKEEKEYLLELISLVEHLYGTTPKIMAHRCSSNAVTVNAYSAEMARDLEKHGGRLSKTKRVSEEILYSPVDLQLELIGSFINGDGHIDKNNAVYTETSSKQLHHNLMWMLSRGRVLWSAQEQYYPVKPHKCGNSIVGTMALTTWKLRLNVNESKKLGSRTTKMSMEWSLDKPRSYNFFYENHIFFPIKEISFDEKWTGNIYNFEVSGDNSYVANSFAVHNCMVNQAVCSVCGNVATGELPEHEDFCDCIRLHKGSQLPINGMFVIPFEINRDIDFFEDTCILPFRLGGKAGGEGADAQAKLLEVFSSKKKTASKKHAYIESNPNPPQTMRRTPDAYMLIGDMPENVQQNKDEFMTEKREIMQRHIDEQSAPGDHPEGTLILIKYEDEEVDAVVVEESDEEGTLIVAIDGIDEPVEISAADVIEIKEEAEEQSAEVTTIADSENSPEMNPEKRAAGLVRK